MCGVSGRYRIPKWGINYLWKCQAHRVYLGLHTWELAEVEVHLSPLVSPALLVVALPTPRQAPPICTGKPSLVFCTPAHHGPLALPSFQLQEPSFSCWKRQLLTGASTQIISLYSSPAGSLLIVQVTTLHKLEKPPVFYSQNTLLLSSTAFSQPVIQSLAFVSLFHVGLPERVISPMRASTTCLLFPTRLLFPTHPTWYLAYYLAYRSITYIFEWICEWMDEWMNDRCQ